MKRKMLLIISLFLLIFPVFVFAEENEPKTWDDIAIKDEKTGIILTEYFQALDFDNLPEGIKQEYLQNQGIRPGSKSFKTIREEAKKDFRFEVEELTDKDPNMKEFLDNFKDKIYSDYNGKLNYFGYKIKIIPLKGQENLGTSKLEIPINKFIEIHEEGKPLITRMERPIWEHGVIICEKSNEYAEGKRNLKEMRYGQWSYNEERIVAKGYDVKKIPAEIVIPQVLKEHYIFIASRKEMPKIPENMMPGTYEVPTIARKKGDVGWYSMAKGSLKEIAEIKVNKYGQKYLYPQFQNMHLMGQNGHLLNLQYYKTLADSELTQAKLIDYYEDPEEGYKKYPQTYEIPLKNNEATKEVFVTVDAMGDQSQSFWLTLNVEGYLKGTRTNREGLRIKNIDMKFH